MGRSDGSLLKYLPIIIASCAKRVLEGVGEREDLDLDLE